MVHLNKKEINYVDIVVGLAWGDEAKAKIVAQLSNDENVKNGEEYDFVCRWQGGHNAGHTVVIDDKIYKLNIIPCGVLHGIKSVIGKGCVVCPKNFAREINYLKEEGIDTSLIKVSPRAHIITEEHIEKDKQKYVDSQGSTGSGIAPCYGDKFLRKGLGVKEYCEYIVNSCKEKRPSLINDDNEDEEDIVSDNDFNDFDEEEYKNAKLLLDHIWDEKLYGNILCEGAQGFWLDIDMGNYPHTTSSNTLPYSACSLGFPPQKIRKIYGAAKIYDTRVGIDPEFPDELLDDEELNKLGELGNEYGTKTGRRRKVDWLRLNKLIEAINISGTTNLIISKIDIIKKLGTYKYYHGVGKTSTYKSYSEMEKFITLILKDSCPLLNDIIYSSSPASF